MKRTTVSTWSAALLAALLAPGALAQDHPTPGQPQKFDLESLGQAIRAPGNAGSGWNCFVPAGLLVN